MKTYIKTTITTEPRLKIVQEEDSESPREWSNLGYFITQDRNYYSPDKNEELQAVIKAGGDEAESLEAHIEYIKEHYSEIILAIYPVNKYEHSGVAYSLGSAFGFDYSNNGFYIITDKTQKEVGTAKKDWEKVIKNELEIYNKYCNGEIYRFTLYTKDGEIEDSCGGFYDIEDIREYLPAEWKQEDLTEYVVW